MLETLVVALCGAFLPKHAPSAHPWGAWAPPSMAPHSFGRNAPPSAPTPFGPLALETHGIDHSDFHLSSVWPPMELRAAVRCEHPKPCGAMDGGARASHGRAEGASFGCSHLTDASPEVSGDPGLRQPQTSQRHPCQYPRTWSPPRTSHPGACLRSGRDQPGGSRWCRMGDQRRWRRR